MFSFVETFPQSSFIREQEFFLSYLVLSFVFTEFIFSNFIHIAVKQRWMHHIPLPQTHPYTSRLPLLSSYYFHGNLTASHHLCTKFNLRSHPKSVRSKLSHIFSPQSFDIFFFFKRKLNNLINHSIKVPPTILRNWASSQDILICLLLITSLFLYSASFVR